MSTDKMIHIFTISQAEPFIKNPPPCKTDYYYGPESSSLSIGSVITKAISQTFPEYNNGKAYVCSCDSQKQLFLIFDIHMLKQQA
jgi:hypothetical protein